MRNLAGWTSSSADDVRADAAAESTEVLRERLRLFARYAALVAEELEARERGDHARLREKLEERERVRAEIAALSGDDESPAPGAALEAAVAEAERRAQAEAEARDWLSRVRDASLRVRGGLRFPRAAGDGYTPTAAVRGALDIRR